MPTERCRVLLIDDDTELAGLLAERLQRDGMALLHADRGEAGLAHLACSPAERPDLVLLDLMLPDVSGIDVFRRLRERWPELPVVMLTAKGDPVDRVVGLELGADDYVAKPFDPRELAARIRAVLRRAAHRPAEGPVRRMPARTTLDVAARTVTGPGGVARLSSIEFKLLDALARAPGRVLSRDALMQAVQVGEYQPLERAVDVQVARLRRKLHAVDGSVPWIATARGEGYLWLPQAP